MPIRLEAYTLSGIVTGTVAWPAHLRDALETNAELQVEHAAFVPLDGRAPSAGGTRPLVVDDVVLAVPDEPMPGPVHAAWHAIAIEAGPYRIEAELATLPGFDPERALARPSGMFVVVRDVRVSLPAIPEVGTVCHEQGLVNRYAVDAIESDLMLGFFFPGARMTFSAAGSILGASDPGEIGAGLPADESESATPPAA
jgi:hypothetical protein